MIYTEIRLNWLHCEPGDLTNWLVDLVGLKLLSDPQVWYDIQTVHKPGIRNKRKTRNNILRSRSTPIPDTPRCNTDDPSTPFYQPTMVTILRPITMGTRNIALEGNDRFNHVIWIAVRRVTSLAHLFLWFSYRLSPSVAGFSRSHKSPTLCP